MGEKRNVYRLLVGKPEGRRPLGKPRRKWVDNIMMDPVEIEWGCVDWIDLARYRYRLRALVNAVTNFRGSIKCRELSNGYTTGHLLSSAQLHKLS
jgi:hypothetical protein